MPTVRVTVHRDGMPVKGHRVRLSFNGVAGGMSQVEYTDSNGAVVFDVERNRNGVVYVDGSREQDWSSYSGSDEITVSL